MTKIKEPKEIVMGGYRNNNIGEWIYNFYCSTCMNMVDNKDQICKYCNEQLKEKHE